jgi:hypothetical protein
MNIKITLFSLAFTHMANIIFSQTSQDSLEIKQSALEYVESQHRPNPLQMEHALHPRMVERWINHSRLTLPRQKTVKL